MFSRVDTIISFYVPLSYLFSQNLIKKLVPTYFIIKHIKILYHCEDGKFNVTR